jgi:predicted aspartyl protease
MLELRLRNHPMREMMLPNRPLIALTLLVAAPVLAASTGARAADSCELHLVASIPAKLSPFNQLLIDVAINDVPVKIQVDTGAVTSTLSAKFATRIGMPIETMAGVIYGLTGDALNQKTRIRTLRLGKAVSSDAAVALTPTGGDGTDDQPVGLFGADYLQNYDVEIDAAGGKVNLFTHNHCPDRVVYWAPDFFKSKIYYVGNSPAHRPTMDITVEGKPLRAVIDTGAYANMMRLAVAQDRFGLSPDSPDMPKVGETKGVEGRALDTYQHMFQSLTFGEITLHNTRMLIAPINTAAHAPATGSRINTGMGDQPDAFIGMSLLKQLHLFIAYDENTLYYTIAKPSQAAIQ